MIHFTPTNIRRGTRERGFPNEQRTSDLLLDRTIVRIYIIEFDLNSILEWSNSYRICRQMVGYSASARAAALKSKTQNGPVHSTRNPSSPDCAILSLTVEGPKMCAFYSPPVCVKFLCGTAETPSRFPSSRLGIFLSRPRRLGQFHRRAMGAPARFASGGETLVVIHLGTIRSYIHDSVS